MANCKFCNEFKEWQESHKNYEFIPVYYIKLVITHIKDGREKGELTSRKHKLRFCPICGKELINKVSAKPGKEQENEYSI